MGRQLPLALLSFRLPWRGKGGVGSWEAGLRQASGMLQQGLATCMWVPQATSHQALPANLPCAATTGRAGRRWRAACWCTTRGGRWGRWGPGLAWPGVAASHGNHRRRSGTAVGRLPRHEVRFTLCLTRTACPWLTSPLPCRTPSHARARCVRCCATCPTWRRPTRSSWRWAPRWVGRFCGVGAWCPAGGLLVGRSQVQQRVVLKGRGR